MGEENKTIAKTVANDTYIHNSGSSLNPNIVRMVRISLEERVLGVLDAKDSEISLLTKRNEELERKEECLKGCECDAYKRCVDRAEASEEKSKRIAQALADFGGHSMACGIETKSGSCSCGFHAAIDASQEEKKDL